MKVETLHDLHENLCPTVDLLKMQLNVACKNLSEAKALNSELVGRIVEEQHWLRDTLLSIRESCRALESMMWGSELNDKRRDTPETDISHLSSLLSQSPLNCSPSIECLISTSSYEDFESWSMNLDSSVESKACEDSTSEHDTVTESDQTFDNILDEMFYQNGDYIQEWQEIVEDEISLILSLNRISSKENLNSVQKIMTRILQRFKALPTISENYEKLKRKMKLAQQKLFDLENEFLRYSSNNQIVLLNNTNLDQELHCNTIEPLIENDLTIIQNEQIDETIKTEELISDQNETFSIRESCRALESMMLGSELNDKRRETPDTDISHLSSLLSGSPLYCSPSIECLISTSSYEDFEWWSKVLIKY